MEEEKYQIELLAGNVFRVRIPSKPFNGHPLPDAVFTFRVGDPQYEVWANRFRDQQANQQSSQQSNRETANRERFS